MPAASPTRPPARPSTIEAQLTLVEDAVEICVYTEIANDVWVKELGPDTYYPVMGGDIRTLSYK